MFCSSSVATLWLSGGNIKWIPGVQLEGDKLPTEKNLHQELKCSFGNTYTLPSHFVSSCTATTWSV